VNVTRVQHFPKLGRSEGPTRPSLALIAVDSPSVYCILACPHVLKASAVGLYMPLHLSMGRPNANKMCVYLAV